MPKTAVMHDLCELSGHCSKQVVDLSSFMKERDHSIDCIHAMSKSFSIPPPFWDYYTNGSFGSRVSKLKVGSVEELFDGSRLRVTLFKILD